MVAGPSDAPSAGPAIAACLLCVIECYMYSKLSDNHATTISVIPCPTKVDTVTISCNKAQQEFKSATSCIARDNKS